MCHFKYDFLCSLGRQVCQWLLHKEHIFWVCNSNMQHCGMVEVQVVLGMVSKEQVDMIMIAVWLLNFGR